VLFHLVTARATVALGGDGTRADQPEAKAPATAAPRRRRELHDVRRVAGR